jgi:hypothetical protein
MSAPRLPPELRARVLDATRRQLVPSRESGRRRRALIVALGFGGALAVGVVLGTPAVAPRPAGYFVLVFAAWVAVALGATWVALGRGRSMLGRPTSQRLAVALLTPAALTVAAFLGSLVWPQTVDGSASVMAYVAHVNCFVWTVVFAVGPLAAFAVVGRSSDPVAPAMGGAALGAAAGAWGGLGIELFCTQATPVHVFLGHVAPVVLLAVVGALVGDRVLRVVAVRAKNG